MKLGLLESSLTPYEKMELYNAGRRRENVGACGDSKLLDYWYICDHAGFKVAKAGIEAEMKKRGLPIPGVKAAEPAPVAPKVEPAPEAPAPVEEPEVKVAPAEVFTKVFIETGLKDAIQAGGIRCELARLILNFIKEISGYRVANAFGAGGSVDIKLIRPDGSSEVYNPKTQLKYFIDDIKGILLDAASSDPVVEEKIRAKYNELVDLGLVGSPRAHI